MYTQAETIQLIEQRFPSLSVDLHHETNEGLLHCQIGEFSRFAQDAIDARNEESWSQVISVFMELWSDCDDEVRNALNVSFLEHLRFEDKEIQRQWAFISMPKIMRDAWEEMDAYLRKLHGA
jgi:hypothetical protein